MLLHDARLEHGEVVVDSTPRRLMVAVSDLAAQQQSLQSRVRGPPVKV